jgi:hypothetical protein
MKTLEWRPCKRPSYTKEAKGLRYYYYIIENVQESKLRIESKWNGGGWSEFNGNLAELEEYANNHNKDVVEKEIGHHKNQLEAIKKQWDE